MLLGAYSLVQVNNILNITCELLDVNEALLLKLPHDAQVAEMFEQRLNQTLKLPTNDASQLNKTVADTFAALALDIRPFNANHLLAYLFTNYFQKGELINLDSLSAVNCWHILHVSLKELKNNPKYDAQALEGLWLGFIGQLVKTNNIDSARAIHNYLHLAQRIANSAACGMGVANSAKVIGSPLLEGLQLKGRLDQAALVQEYVFMAKVSEILLGLSIFSQPFTVDAYASWSLPKGAFYSIQATILGALCDPSTPSPYYCYASDVLKTQTQQAARTRVKQVRFANEKELDDKEAIEAVVSDFSTFSLVSSETLLSHFQSKRLNSSSTQDVVELTSLDDNPGEMKKPRKGSLTFNSSHKK